MNTQTQHHLFCCIVSAAFPLLSLIAYAGDKAFEPPLPSLDSFEINNGNSLVSGRGVTLNNTASDYPAEYVASEDPNFTGGSWQPYNTAPTFTLSAGNGPKTVYLKLRNVTGESNVLSDVIDLVEPPVVQTFAINGGDASTNSRDATLDNTCTNNPTEYMASEDSAFDGASWEPYGTSPDFSLSSGNGTKTVYFKTRNTGGESNVVIDTIELAQVPVITSFAINGGAATADSFTVTLDNTCSHAPAEYMASESATFADASWLPYDTAPSFTLSPENGTKTVYLRVRNAYGESEAASDSVAVQAPLPEIAFFGINMGAASTDTRDVTLNTACTGDPTEMIASEDANFAGASWGPYNAAAAFQLSDDNETKTVYVKVRNTAGESSVATDSIELDVPPPPPVVASLNINGGAATTASHNVTLHNACSGAPTHYMASEDSGFAGAAWESYDAAPLFVLGPGNGAKVVYFKALNAGGESNVVSDTIALTVPVPVILSFKINNGAESTESRDVTLNLSSNGSPIDVIASESIGFAGAGWQPYSTAVPFTLSEGAGVKTVYVMARNADGPSDPVSDTIEYVIPQPPVVVSMVINDDEPETTSSIVMVQTVCNFKPAECQVSEDPTFDGAFWRQYIPAIPFTLSPESGEKTVYFRARNSAGESGTASDSIVLNPFDVPEVISFHINNGALQADSPAVSLMNICTNAPTHYITSEDPEFGDAEWMPYDESPPFTLSPGLGEKRVYFKAKNAIGESTTVSDAITRVNPSSPAILSLDINEGAASTTSTSVTLNNSCEYVPTHYMASEDPGFTDAEWLPYDPAPWFILSAEPGEKLVYFKVKNDYGYSGMAGDSIILNVAAPVIESFAINDDEPFTGSTTVTLTNLCVNSPTHYMASEDPAFGDAAWLPYNPAPAFDLSPTPGLKTVYFKVKNATGQSEVAEDLIEYTPVPPSVTSFVVNNGDAETESATVTLSSVCEGSPLQCVASELADFSDAAWVAYQPETPFTLSTGTGEKTVYFKVRNDAGESGVASDSILVSECAPPAPTGVQATDWVGDFIRIVWLPVEGNDVEYQVYRGGAPLSPWLTDPIFEDCQKYSGCGPAINRTYTVVARNACGTSPQSVADTGDHIVSGGVMVLGMMVPDDDGPAFAVRWNHDYAKPGSLTASASLEGVPVAGTAAWHPSPGAGHGWIIFTPDAPVGEEGMFTVNASADEMWFGTANSHTVSYTFNLADTATLGVEPDIVELEDGLIAPIDPIEGSPLYQITPHALFLEPVTVQIPVPDDLDGETAVIWYFGEALKGVSWCPERTLGGWLVSGSRHVVEIGGQEYLEFQVNHSGIVQLGAPWTKHVSAGTGYFAVLVLVVYVFGGRNSPMRRKTK